MPNLGRCLNPDGVTGSPLLGCLNALPLWGCRRRLNWTVPRERAVSLGEVLLMKAVDFHVAVRSDLLDPDDDGERH